MFVRRGSGRAGLVLHAWMMGWLGSGCQSSMAESQIAAEPSMSSTSAEGSASEGSEGSTSAEGSEGSTSANGSTSTTGSTTGAPDEGTTGDAPSGPDYGQPGPHPVGHVRIEIDDTWDKRVLPVEIWYPADPAEAEAAAIGIPIEEFEPPGLHRQLLAALAAAAPAGCTRTQTRSAAEALPAETGALYPLVVFSHCHMCMRFSSFSIAEHLASHGFAVAAVDHVENTLFDALAGTGVAISDEFLMVRAADVSRVLDVLLSGDSPEMPPALAARFDPTRVGAMGHSFGGATIGRVLQNDDRVHAGLVITAPVQSFILPGSPLAAIDEPLMLMLAQEDNAILELGNDYMRANFADANPPVWLVEVADTGHWSFSDVCALLPELSPGCGEGLRQTVPGSPFAYLDNELARGIASAYAARFFAAHLRDEPGADAALDVADPEDLVTVSVRRE